MTHPLASVLSELSLDRPTTRFTGGSLPVHAVGEDLVLKFYPAEEAEESRIEAAALTTLEEHLPTPTPRLLATGTREGWHYVLMTRVPGVGLDAVWDTLTTDERRALCWEAGVMTAELHAVTEHPAPLVTDWTAFVRARREAVVDHHRRQELPPEWLELVPEFVDGVDLPVERPVFLHTELLREHILVRHDGNRWRISGLIDFEPAMVGAAEYEFVAASVYLAGADPACWHAFLRGYGLEPDVDFARRCLAYTLLHRYSTLRRYLTWLPVPGKPSLDELARLWFGADVT
ncbi:phosphotransferase family protein [Saccharomonospora azurea]|uniref:phosphotransferase family protein n=1 Tax=Saccharomonospora azurea TaxID=40988 RepID=UPI003D8DC8FA